MTGVTMADPSVRARSLVALAVDSATTESEARNAAYAAAQIIVRHDLLIVSRAGKLRTEPRGPQAIRAKYAATCADCGGPIAVGAPCLWLRGTGVWHLTCHVKKGSDHA